MLKLESSQIELDDQNHLNVFLGVDEIPKGMFHSFKWGTLILLNLSRAPLLNLPALLGDTCEWDNVYRPAYLLLPLRQLSAESEMALFRTVAWLLGKGRPIKFAHHEGVADC